MNVVRRSTLTGKVHIWHLNVTHKQLALYAEGEALIQNVFPDLNADEREFIKTGITPKEWAEMAS